MFQVQDEDEPQNIPPQERRTAGDQGDVGTELERMRACQMDSVKAQVRASSNASDSSILAALDTLVETAAKMNHKDHGLFQNLRAQALRLKDDLSIGGLCIEVLADKTDDRLASAINKGLREEKSKRDKKEKAKDSTDPLRAWGPHPQLPMVYQSPLQGIYPAPAPPLFGPPGMVGHPGSRFPKKRKIACYFCGGEHVIRECQQLNTMKRNMSN